MNIPVRKLRGGTQPETKIVNKLTSRFKAAGCYVKKLHGNAFQSGLPDLLVISKQWGTIFVEVKTPRGKLSPRQINEFAKMSRVGAKIFVINNADNWDIVKTKKPNWAAYATGQTDPLKEIRL